MAMQTMHDDACRRMTGAAQAQEHVTPPSRASTSMSSMHDHGRGSGRICDSVTTRGGGGGRLERPQLWRSHRAMHDDA
jgi:hypothetical protein